MPTTFFKNILGKNTERALSISCMYPNFLYIGSVSTDQGSNSDTDQKVLDPENCIEHTGIKFN
jgi:hypothetical protein